MNHLGTQWTAELYGCDAAVLDDVERITSCMLEAATVARATIVGSRFHRFSPHGVSGVVIIAESHLAIHTWPEHGYAALDVFSCGEILLAEAAFRFLAEAFGASHVEAVRQHRGAPDRIAALRTPARPPLRPDRLGAPPGPDLVRPPAALRAVGAQVHALDLLTPAGCALLLAECAHQPHWLPAPDGEALALDRVPALAAFWGRVLADALRPALEDLWPGWRLQRWEASVVHQRPGDAPARPAAAPGALTLVTALDAGFAGGGLAFPAWDLTVGEGADAVPGRTWVFPSGLSHACGALPVTSGARTVLVTTLH